MEDQEAVNLAADWADISQGLRKDLGHQLHSQWIKPIQVGGIDKDSGTLDLFLPTEFSANWVKDRCADRLSLAWKIARSEVRDVRIQVHPGRRQVADLRLHSDGRRPANDGADTSMMAIGADTLGDTGFTSSVGLDPSLTFAAFITGEANVLAHMPDAMILRPSVIFGPEDNFFNRFAGMSRMGPVLPVVGADTKFQPVYVNDVARAAASRDGRASRGIEVLDGSDATRWRRR